MLHRGNPVRLDAIRRTALMTIEGAEDDITTPGQTHAAHRLLTGIPPEWKDHHLQEGAGHYGTFSGRKFREQSPRGSGRSSAPIEPEPAGERFRDLSRAANGSLFASLIVSGMVNPGTRGERGRPRLLGDAASDGGRRPRRFPRWPLSGPVAGCRECSAGPPWKRGPAAVGPPLVVRGLARSFLRSRGSPPREPRSEAPRVAQAGRDHCRAERRRAEGRNRPEPASGSPELRPQLRVARRGEAPRGEGVPSGRC